MRATSPGCAQARRAHWSRHFQDPVQLRDSLGERAPPDKRVSASGSRATEPARHAPGGAASARPRAPPATSCAARGDDPPQLAHPAGTIAPHRLRVAHEHVHATAPDTTPCSAAWPRASLITRAGKMVSRGGRLLDLGPTPPSGGTPAWRTLCISTAESLCLTQRRFRTDRDYPVHQGSLLREGR
jgi:hypothetical protein